MANKSTIEYRIAVANNPSYALTLLIDLDEQGFNVDLEEKHQSWTALSNHQCPGCPLSTNVHAVCPLAARISTVVDIFAEVASFDQVDVTAKVGSRTVSQRVSVQQVLGSVMGLLFATSGCPHTAFFRPLALNHQPLATEAETVYRIVANYLTHQFIRMEEGEEPDLALEGLHAIYDRMHEIHIHIAKRLRAMPGTEPILNGLTLLDTLAMSIPMKLKSSKRGFQNFYSSYLAERERELRGTQMFHEPPPVEEEKEESPAAICL